MNFTLTDSEKQILLQTARETIRARLNRVTPDYPQPTAGLKEKCGAFVTLNKLGRLRGCIGYVEALKPLIETVKEVAESSAFGDPRFPPVQLDELPGLEIEISVLSPLKRIRSIEKIQVGLHGIMIKKGYYSGLLLPQVATEYGWDRETFLIHTCQKAGLPGDCWREIITKDKKKEQEAPARDRASRGPKLEIKIFSALIINEKEFARR
ncbi:hypothetical protein ES703_22881 [subsurface metagenome]